MINLDANFEGFRRAKERFDAVQKRSDDGALIMLRMWASEAAKKVTPLVARYVVENWRKQGLGETGYMESLLQQIKVIASVKSNGSLRIYMMMPARAEPYRRARKDGSVVEVSPYVVAGAQNYGAVRMKQATKHLDRPPVGTNAKRSIKKLALKGSISKQAMTAITKGYRRKGVQVTSGFDIGNVVQVKMKKGWANQPKDTLRQTSKPYILSAKFSSGVVVIAPKTFYELDAAQRVRFASEFESALLEALEKQGV